MKDIETKLKEKFVELLKVRNLDEIGIPVANTLCSGILFEIKYSFILL